MLGNKKKKRRPLREFTDTQEPERSEFMLDPSVLLGEASSVFRREAMIAHDTVVSPTLANMVLGLRGGRGTKHSEIYGQLRLLWQLSHEEVAHSIERVRDKPEPLLRALHRSRGLLKKAETERRTFYAALKAATRELLPFPWSVEGVLYEQIALTQYRGFPALCQATSPPAFVEIMKELGARVAEETVDELEDATEAVREFSKAARRWKENHLRLVKSITIATIGAAEIMLSFVSPPEWKEFAPSLARTVVESLVVLYMDPP